LAGKKNILFRIGKKKGAALFMTAHLSAYLLVVTGASLNILPRYSLLALIGLPTALKGVVLLARHYDEPVKLTGTVNNTIFSYLTVNGVLVISLILAAY
jgi:1,4-dihydroxy-2-naphthoate octaprenyltransferase